MIIFILYQKSYIVLIVLNLINEFEHKFKHFFKKNPIFYTMPITFKQDSWIYYVLEQNKK